MTTGHYITTRVINKIRAEQTEYITINRPILAETKNGITIYGISSKERIPIQKELVASLERCRHYIHNKYLNVELTKIQVEDIFRFLCSDINWRIIINNKKDSELLNKFYGGQVRTQDPLITTQAHVVYTFLPRLWLALDYTYYVGGATTLNGQEKNDRQDNSRTGVTLAVPVNPQHSLKMTWARGVTTRIGDSYDTIGFAWQYVWF